MQMLVSCGTDGGGLTLINSYKIDVPEPSGLSFDANQEALFTVSDKTNNIYKLSLEGKLLKTIECDADDLEGITYSKTDNTIWIADERKRKLKQLNIDGNTLKSFKIKVKAKKKNAELEGLTINNLSGNLLCLNEKKPGLLIETNQNGEVLEKHKLDFAKDYSGIYHDAETNNLWIVSDKSMTITQCDMKGNILNNYQTDIESMEGIVVDSNKKLIYVVSDELQKLFVFQY